MGRLSFLKRTAHRLLAQPHIHYCLTDYSCPDKSGDWFESSFPEAIAQGRAVVERVPGRTLFNKCVAHNAGAARAKREGAEFLCFIDADTIVERGFSEFVVRRMRDDRFLIAALRPDGTDMASMTGLLVVSVARFEKVGGFDTNFRGWGGEDIELRLRLYMLGGIDPVDVPLDFVRPIPHANSLRTRFYDQNSINASNRNNFARIMHKMSTEWAGRSNRPRAGAGRLWYHPPRLAARSMPRAVLPTDGALATNSRQATRRIHFKSQSADRVAAIRRWKRL